MAAREGSMPKGKSNHSLFLTIGFFFGCVAISAIAILAGNLQREDWRKKHEQFEITINEYSEKISILEEAVKEKDVSVTSLIMGLRPQLDPSIAEEINVAIIKYSREYRLPPTFVLHLMKRESNFDVLADSKAGAVGLMQVMPKAHKDKMKKIGITNGDLYHIDNNVRLGCWILREYFDKTGTIEKALKRYVGGHHSTYANDILTGFTNTMIPKKMVPLEKSKVPEPIAN
jgi:hypothetical protein